MKHYLKSTCFFLAMGLGITTLFSQQSDSTKVEPRPGPTNIEHATTVLSNPRDAVKNHLANLQAGNYFPAEAALSLHNEKPDGTEYGQKKLEELAIKLKQIFDGRGFYVVLEEIPAQASLPDSLFPKQVVTLHPSLPEIFLSKEEGKWRYSRRSVAHINDLHDNLYPLGSDIILSLVPISGNQTFFGLKLWQYVGILLMLLLGFVLYKVVDFLLNALIRRLVPLFSSLTAIEAKHVAPLAHPLSYFLVFFGISKLIPALQFPIQVSSAVTMVFNIVLPVFGILVFLRLADLVALIASELAGATTTTMDDQLVPLIKKFSKLVIIILGFIFVLDNLEVDVTALLAGVSIGGLALALAAQDTVKNLIGSLTIFVDRPFQIGDFIDGGKASGTVEEVGVRSTRLRSADGSQVSIPNGELANLTVTNHGLRTFRRYVTTIGLTYDTSPSQMEKFVEGVREITNNHPKTREDSAVVYFHEMGPSSLDIYYSAHFDDTDFKVWLGTRQDIFLAIMHLAEEIGVGFAFPSTSVYVESMPGKG